jgi:hypothetical protein
LRQMRNECAMYHEEENKSMCTVRSMVNPSLFALFGIVVFAAVCFASTLPRVPRLVEQEDGTVHSLAAQPVSRNSVATAHGPRSKAARPQTAEGSKPTSEVKTNKSLDRKPPQTTSALTGCKDFSPVNGAPAVPGEKNSPGKTHDNSQEKSLCNAQNPRSR